MSGFSPALWCSMVQPHQTAWRSPGSETTIPIAENLAEMLREFIGDRRDGLLFVNQAVRNLLRSRSHYTL
jgi:hypothetical protein